MRETFGALVAGFQAERAADPCDPPRDEGDRAGRDTARRALVGGGALGVAAARRGGTGAPPGGLPAGNRGAPSRGRRGRGRRPRDVRRAARRGGAARAPLGARSAALARPPGSLAGSPPSGRPAGLAGCAAARLRGIRSALMNFRGGMNELMRQAARMQRKIDDVKKGLKDKEVTGGGRGRQGDRRRHLRGQAPVHQDRSGVPGQRGGSRWRSTPSSPPPTPRSTPPTSWSRARFQQGHRGRQAPRHDLSVFLSRARPRAFVRPYERAGDARAPRARRRSCSPGCPASARRRRSATRSSWPPRTRRWRASSASALAELRDHVRPCARCGNIAEAEAGRAGRLRRLPRHAAGRAAPLRGRAGCRTCSPSSGAAPCGGATSCSAGCSRRWRGWAPRSCRIDALKERVRGDQVAEVLVATPPSVDGEATALLARARAGPARRPGHPHRQRRAPRGRPGVRRPGDARSRD